MGRIDKDRPKILVFVPLAPQTPRLYRRALRSILELEASGYVDVVLGKEDLDTRPTLRGGYRNLCAKYEHARKLALAGGYDALLTIESDMIVPPDTVTRLTAVDADVAYGLYCSRHGRHQWLAFTTLESNFGWTISDNWGEARQTWGKVIETQGCGMGCTLIWRHVLETVPFRLARGPLVANDWHFSLDLQAHGYVQKHDLGVVCGHIAPDPLRIIWPDPEAFALHRVELLEKVPVIPPGQTVEITLDRFGAAGVYKAVQP